jgi:cytochrome oxidase assembly protein ShyY1
MPDTATHSSRFQWDIEWRSALFALVFVPLFIALGFWQLSRAEEKAAIAASWERKREQAPVPLVALEGDPAAMAYRQVVLAGRFLAGRDFLLDNRLRDGRYGVEVLSPLRLESGELVLVNRGWIAADPYRRSLPELPGLRGRQVLTGYVYVAPGESYTIGEISTSSDWPRLVQAIDLPALENLLGEPLWDYTVRLASDSPGALLADWPLINVRPEKHQAYAAQWFAMAAVLFVFATWRNSNLADLWRRQRERKKRR